MLEIEAKRSVSPHKCLSYLSLHVFQINSKHPTAWEMTTLWRQPEVTLWWTQWSISAVDFSGEIVTPGHFDGALSAPAKCRESDGRSKEMICGHSSTLMVLTLHAVYIVAGEYIVETRWGTRIQFDQAKKENMKEKSCRIFEWFSCCYINSYTMEKIISTMFYCWKTAFQGYP